MPNPSALMALPKSDLCLSRLSLGTGSIAGLYRAVSQAEARETLETAWNFGIRYFDTAPHYGQGLAETRLGDFLRGKSGQVVSSKVGRLLRSDMPLHPTQLDYDGTPFFKDSPPLGEVYDYSYAGVMQSLEDSLNRTSLNAIDVLYIHDPDADGRSVDEVMSGGYRALLKLRQQGTIKAIGVGMNQVEMMTEFATLGDFDVMLLAGRYTLLEQGGLGFLEQCHQRGIGVVLGGVFNSGLLANPNPNAPYNYGKAPAQLVERALAIQAVCLEFGIELKAAALQFALGHPAVVSVVTVSFTRAEVAENHRMMQLEIPFELWLELKQRGLLEQHIPTPQEA